MFNSINNLLGSVIGLAIPVLGAYYIAIKNDGPSKTEPLGIRVSLTNSIKYTGLAFAMNSVAHIAVDVLKSNNIKFRGILIGNILLSSLILGGGYCTYLSIKEFDQYVEEINEDNEGSNNN